jgi:hypothetical protein
MAMSRPTIVYRAVWLAWSHLDYGKFILDSRDLGPLKALGRQRLFVRAVRKNYAAGVAADARGWRVA